MKRNISLALSAVRELGVYPVWLYASYEVQRRVGWLRFRTPIRDWDSYNLYRQTAANSPKYPESYCEYRTNLERQFFFKPKADISHKLMEILAGNDEILLAEADGILEGKFSLFGRPSEDVGFPPEWNKFPPSAGIPDEPLDEIDAHWSRINIESLPGDVKYLWELSRFGWVFILGRAYRLTKNPKYAQAFWRLLESWREANPPNRGFQWISAQEVAIRLLALIFGHYAFRPYLDEEPQYMVLLTETIAAHADRIPSTLLYSRAQGNNHLIVEAVSLYSTGLLFPELTNARNWRRIGRRWFISAISDQVFSDGGYAQHSANYHRLAQQVSLWGIRLGELNDEPFPEPTYESLRKMSVCLRAIVDTESGKVPNFGANDGALIFPLAACSFNDYRPLLQASSQLMFGERIFAPGPWNEEGFWFGKADDTEKIEKDSSEWVPSKAKKDFPTAGLFILGQAKSWGLFRCVNFNNRPGHSDQLHLDLWWKGENIARDPGTYLYSGADLWENGLATSKTHNTIVVDEMEPMRQAGRFLWLNWTQGEILDRGKTETGNLEFIVAQHYGYKAMGITTLRSIIRAGDSLWLVVDDLRGNDFHKLRNGWLLPDAPWKSEGNSLTIEGSVGEFKIELLTQDVQWGLIRAGELIEGEPVADCGQVLGWYSPTYSYKEPGLFLAATVEGELPLRLVTRWCLGDVDRERLRVEWDESGVAPSSLKRITFGEEVLEL